MVDTILIVDDDPALVEMFTFMLGRGGFQTRAAYDGTRALEILESEPIDLVVLDVMLPDMDGFEICRRIRRIPEIGELPILMLSARTLVADRLSGFESGADDYVPKPADPKEILARVRALLSRAERGRGVTAPAITFLGAKGGVGTTTTALNVALSLVADHRRTVFFELGCVGLTAAWILSLEPSQTLLDLTAPSGFTLTMGALKTCIFSHRSGLDYLPGHGHAISEGKYCPGLLAETIGLLQSQYDVVIIDLGVSALVASPGILIHSSAVVPVAEYDDACIWHLRALLDWLRQSGVNNKVPGFVLVDRTSGPSKPPASEVASRVGLGILAVIPPAAAALYHANSRREPLFLADPDSPTSVGIAELGRRVTATPIEVPLTLRP